MALAGGGDPLLLSPRRLLNAAYVLELDDIRAVCVLDSEAYAAARGRLDDALHAPLPRPEKPAPEDPAEAAAERMRQRIAQSQAMGGQVEVY